MTSLTVSPTTVFVSEWIGGVMVVLSVVGFAVLLWSAFRDEPDRADETAQVLPRALLGDDSHNAYVEPTRTVVIQVPRENVTLPDDWEAIVLRRYQERSPDRPDG
jgi:hypothetical protein